MVESQDKLLLNYVKRIERINEDIDALKEDLKQIYSEVKSAGFDVKTVKTVVKLRKKDPDDVEAEKALIETYQNAIFNSEVA